jgi:hypothetical protein
MTVHLGGFQEAAHHLTKLSGEPRSRQSVMRLWERRLFNGFPDMENFVINGHQKKYFLLSDVTTWWRSHHG